MLPIHRTRVSVFNYDEIPPGYYYHAMKEGSAIQRFWHREKFREIALRIGEGERVLDLGCGPGSFLSVLGELRPKMTAVGVDIASKQIEFAIKEVGERLGTERIGFTQLDQGDPRFPFPDESFDTVTCIEVIEHVHPYLVHQMLLEARRVLKPHGKLFVTTPNYRSFWPVIEFLLEKMSPVKYHDQHINKFTPNSLVKFLETLGFEIEKVNTIFVAAPFLAPLSKTLANSVHRLERKFNPGLGSLLVAQCRKLDLKSLQ